MPITVSIDFTTNPPTATFNPETQEIDDKNCQIFRWVRAAGQTFTFVSVQWINNETVEPLPNPPFSQIFLFDGGATMVIADFNPTGGSDTSYPYQITVAYAGANYSFPPAPTPSGRGGGDPAIHNK